MKKHSNLAKRWKILAVVAFAAFGWLPELGLSTAEAAHIHYTLGYDGPWKWAEVTMTTTVQGEGMNQTTHYQGTACITGYVGNATSLGIPSKISWTGSVTASDGSVSLNYLYEVDVVEIGDGAFANRNDLTSVTICDSVASIGRRAFENCGSLTNVTVGAGVTDLKEAAFYGCGNLKNLTILGNVMNDFKEFADYPFTGCTNLETVMLDGNMTKIGTRMFLGCSGITRVTVGNSVRSIGDYAFKGGRNLTSLTIGNGVRTIGWGAFQYCNSLTDVVIPDSVTSIGACAFYNCTSLTNATIGDGVKSIGFDAFCGCCNLARLHIGNSVTSIGDSAFSICENLENVTIPEHVTCIGSNAFGSCSGLRSVTVLGNVTNNWSRTPPFSHCTNIETIVLGEKTTSIGNNMFYDSFRLKNVTILGNVTNDWGLYTRPFSSTNIETVVLGEKMGKIGSYLFYDCPNIQSLTIPGNVTNIGGYAFYNCRGLETVTMGERVGDIGNCAFYGCRNLVSIAIPGNAGNLDDCVGSIGHHAFYGCSNLVSIAIPGNVNNIGYYAFFGCTSIRTVSIHGGVTEIGSLAFAGCTNLSRIDIPASVTNLETSAFGCGLTSLTVTGASGITANPENAFGYSGGKNIYLPEHLQAFPLSSLTNSCCVIYYPETDLADAAVTLPDGALGLEYAVRAISHGAASWQAEGLPAGLAIADNGLLTGTPLETGKFEATLTAFDDAGLPLVTRTFHLLITPTDGIEVVDGIPWLYSLENGEATLVWTNLPNGQLRRAVPFSTSGPLTLPSILGGYPVREVKSTAFRGLSGVTYLSIPESIRRLGGNLDSFGNMTSLKEVSIACNPTNSFLSSLSCPFAGCMALETVIFENGVTNIWDYAFRIGGNGVSSLKHVTIPGSVTRIGREAFGYAQALESIALPDKVKDIGVDAFYGTALYSIDIPESVTNIAAGAFSSCTNLVSASIGTATTNTGRGLFAGVHIGDEAFSCCYALSRVTLSDSVVSIGWDAFYKCSNLRHVSIGNGMTCIEANAFDKCPEALFDVTSIPGVRLVDGWAVGWTNLQSGDLDLAGVRGFADRAFARCTNLTSVVIPNGVTRIGNEAFRECRGLTRVTLSSGLTSIGASAFTRCTNLTSVAVPSSVTSLGNNAFAYCSGLTNVTFPEGLTDIGDEAFRECSSLTGVAIPDSVARIGNRAFYSCSDTVFDTTSIPGVSLVDGWAVGWTNLFSGELDLAGVRGVGDNAFYSCTNLTKMTISDSVTSIGNYAFMGCSGLLDVAIADSVTSIGSNAFSNCGALMSLTIPDNVASIGDGTFSGSGLKTLYVPASWAGTLLLDHAGVPDECTIVYGTPHTEEVTSTGVPHGWLEANAAALLAANGGDHEATAKAPAANGMPVWQCYVAGLPPTDAEAAFKVKSISVVDGESVIKWDPNLESDRVYVVEGKASMMDEWGPRDAASRFFRVRVALPE